jgi:hypothetical protein
MEDHRDREGNRGESRSGRGDDRSREDHPRDERGERGGIDRGPDTRFLQLELSQVLYTEAEAVTRPAFRELLQEAAKVQLRERFGREITALAQLAVDELMDGVQASFEIEARIQHHNEERHPHSERLRELFAARRGSRPARAEKRERRTSSRAKGRR